MRLWPLFFAAAAVASCSGFKSGSPDAGDGGGAGEGGGGEGGGGGMTGPGPRGALPSGYCCASNADCRHRNCVDIGGSKMCADECQSQDACDGGLPGFTCVGGSQYQVGRCEPPASTQCVPASKFSYGAKKLGACCTPTWNGANGFECEGGFCGQTGNGPFMCSNACAKASDCPGPFMCSPVGNNYSICVPLDSSQACTS